MKRMIALFAAAAVAILSAGCQNFVTADKTVNMETKVYGIIGAIPIPGLSGIENILELKAGAIVSRYQSVPKDSKNRPYSATVYEKISLFSLSGGGKSIMSIGTSFPCGDASGSTETDSISANEK